MGLDMYLTADRYISGYDFAAAEQKETYQTITSLLGFGPDNLDTDTPSLTVSVNVGYWRKANAIHNWFVQNVQDGVDKCQKAYVSRSDLANLRRLCVDILETVEMTGTDEMDSWAREVIKIDADKANGLLPPKKGFFFGEYDLDEWYVQSLKDTVSIIDRITAMPQEQTGDLYYQSSW